VPTDGSESEESDRLGVVSIDTKTVIEHYAQLVLRIRVAVFR
jgi:hypothetical protein